MRSASRVALLVAAIALPIAVIYGSYALTSGPRAPQIPTRVEVGSSPSTRPAPPTSHVPPEAPQPRPPQPPNADEDDDLGPPAPDDDDDAGDRDRDDD